MCYARRQRSSWARIKLSNKLYILRCIAVRFVWAIYLSFLYFFRVVFSLVLTDFVFALAFFALYFFYLLFNCQVSIPLSSREPVYYITSLLPCQEVFQNFFKKLLKILWKTISFLLKFKSRYLAAAPSGNSYILPRYPNFVKWFWKKKFFLVKFSKRIVMISIFYTLYPI